MRIYIYILCRALGAFVYLDFTMRCLFFLQDFRVGLPVVDEDDDGLVVVVGAWLVEGEGSPSLAAAEGRPPQFWAKGRPSQELVEVESAPKSDSSSFCCAAKIIGTS